MSKYVISRYNHDLTWLNDYVTDPNDVVLYDRSEKPIEGAIVSKNIGSDIYDKFTFIIDNYDNLPDVAIYTKANLFKYITKEEFDEVKDNKQFTPLLTQFHKTRREGNLEICFYENGMYFEINNCWYLNAHPVRDTFYIYEIQNLMGYGHLNYVPFAPGSNYIIPKENIKKYPKYIYEKLRNYLEWTIYPGEAQLIERGLYTFFS